MPGGRPRKEYDAKLFADYVALGCTEDEICWLFRDGCGKPASKDTLNRWCKRTFDMGFAEYARKNRAMGIKIKLRQYQLELAKKSAAMAIFLGKQYLGQSDNPQESIDTEDTEAYLAEAGLDDKPED